MLHAFGVGDEAISVQKVWTTSPEVGIQEPAFQVSAEELQPWLNRFVR